MTPKAARRRDGAAATGRGQASARPIPASAAAHSQRSAPRSSAVIEPSICPTWCTAAAATTGTIVPKNRMYARSDTATSERKPTSTPAPRGRHRPGSSATGSASSAAAETTSTPAPIQS